MITMQMVQKQICDLTESAIEQIFGQKPELVDLKPASDLKFGDFSIACFQFAKEFKKSPVVIAKVIAEGLNINLDQATFASIESVGPYINFRIQNELMFGIICFDHKRPDLFDWVSIGLDKTVMVEYLSPNTNKPLHLGHVRNGTLGMALSNILAKVGYNVIKTNLINDRGIHICKAMLSWQRWGNGITPEIAGEKGDHFVGKYYVMFAQEFDRQIDILKAEQPEFNDTPKDELFLKTEIGQAAQEMLVKWEAGDENVRSIWRMMNQWVYAGFHETYCRYGFLFDHFYHESETYLLGRDIVQLGIEKGAFVTDKNGFIVAPLPVEKFGLEVGGRERYTTVLRQDGTSVYMTQDIGTANLKNTQYSLDRSIHVVGSEQNYHFQCLFHILETLGFPWASGCYHLSYGMVYLPHGKMKSREGTAVDADNLLNDVAKIAAINVRSHDESLSDEEVQDRAEKIAIGAIKYFLLRFSTVIDIHFDPEESLSFEGNTGPYCQYAFARACTLVEKASMLNLDEQPNFELLGNLEERALAQKINSFTDCVKASAEDMNPARLTNYLFELAQSFSSFYEKNMIISPDNIGLTTARLALVKAMAFALEQGFDLLGIPVLRKM